MRKGTTVVKTCIACKRQFEGHFNATVCSDECRQARRRGRDAGVDALPPPTRDCEVCGTPFRARLGIKVCSDECRKTRQRERWRRYWHEHPEKQADSTAKAKERRKAKPEMARAQNARKHARIRSSPLRLAKVRQKAREHYHRHAEEIQAKRRAKVAALSDAELAELIERRRRYCREHRRRQRSDPARAEAARMYEREWKRRRIAGTLQVEAAILLREAGERIDGGKSNPARPCEVCGRPVLGRHSTAKTCSDDCQRKRTLSRLYPPRARACLVCGKEITAKTSALLCSRECKLARKAATQKALRAAQKESR